MLERLKTHARSLKREAIAIYIAAKDPRTPWYARALVFFVVAHTFSPIDLIPEEVLAEARARVTGPGVESGVGFMGAVLVVLTWILTAAMIIFLVLFLQS